MKRNGIMGLVYKGMVTTTTEWCTAPRNSNVLYTYYNPTQNREYGEIILHSPELTLKIQNCTKFWFHNAKKEKTETYWKGWLGLLIPEIVLENSLKETLKRKSKNKIQYEYLIRFTSLGELLPNHVWNSRQLMQLDAQSDYWIKRIESSKHPYWIPCRYSSWFEQYDFVKYNHNSTTLSGKIPETIEFLGC